MIASSGSKSGPIASVDRAAREGSPAHLSASLMMAPGFSGADGVEDVLGAAPAAPGPLI